MNAEDFFVVYDFVPEHSYRHSRYWEGYIDRAYFDSEEAAMECAQRVLYGRWLTGDFDLDQKRKELREGGSVDLGDRTLATCYVMEFRNHDFYPAMLAEAVKQGADLTYSQAKLALPHLR